MYSHMPHGFGGMRRRTHGRKGGTSPNTGKKAATYSVELPDGHTVTKRTFQTRADEAVAMIYEHGGVWHVSAIEPEARSWPGQQPHPARRVK